MDSQLFARSDRLRSLGPAAAVEVFGPPNLEKLSPDGANGTLLHIPLGDQGYFYAIRKQRPDLFAHMPLKWEVCSPITVMTQGRIKANVEPGHTLLTCELTPCQLADFDLVRAHHCREPTA